MTLRQKKIVMDEFDLALSGVLFLSLENKAWMCGKNLNSFSKKWVWDSKNICCSIILVKKLITSVTLFISKTFLFRVFF